MKLFCAVDIRGGRCVRLRQGDYGAETVYSGDPVAVAAQMAADGADWIHVVDLDGARSGRPDNAEAVAAIAAVAEAPVQAGGGVRTVETAEAWYAAGVERLVLGTAALRDPGLVRSLARTHRVAVGLDARAGQVATDGWTRGSGRSVLQVAGRFADTAVDALVVTDIARDGTLAGPDLAGLAAVLDATAEAGPAASAPPAAAGPAGPGGGISVIASGGVSGLDDLRALARLRGGPDGRRRLSGVIVGKALYEKRFTVAEAAAALSAAEASGEARGAPAPASAPGEAGGS